MSTLARAHISRTRSHPHPAITIIDRSAVVIKKPQSATSVPKTTSPDMKTQVTVKEVSREMSRSCEETEKQQETKKREEAEKREEAWEAKVREEEKGVKDGKRSFEVIERGKMVEVWEVYEEIPGYRRCELCCWGRQEGSR
jgi:hypothetical protein